MTDQALEHIEEEVLAPEVETLPEPLSLREELAKAVEETKEPKTDEPKADKPKLERKRADDGKFAEGKAKPVKAAKDVSHESSVAQPDVSTAAIPIPKSFNQGLGAEWSKLPRPLQEQLAKREEDYHKELTKHDEERNFGRTVRDIASPYIPLIKAEGGDLTKGFQDYLNTAYILRTKSPQEKGQLILKLAQEFGADLRGASQAQPQAHPAIQQLQQEIAVLKAQREQETTFKKQQEESAVTSQIDAFRADPKNVHFETVKAHMAALLRSGMAKDLDDAYDQAVYANPHTRSTLLQAQTNTSEEQRVATQKAKAEAARRAGSSIKGAPGMGALKNGKIVQQDLRSELKAQFAALRDG